MAGFTPFHEGEGLLLRFETKAEKDQKVQKKGAAVKREQKEDRYQEKRPNGGGQ